MSLVQSLKDSVQDFEFYPTTDEIIQCLSDRIGGDHSPSWGKYQKSFLDVGAGDGRVCSRVKEIDRVKSTFGIEKSPILRDLWPSSLQLVGVDFHNVNFYDKDIDLVFSNPPFSEYEEWATKLIKELASGCTLFLVLPEGWKNRSSISKALESRENKTKILGNFSFREIAHRKARVDVDLIEIKFPNHEESPFSRFFEENFSYPEPTSDPKFEEKIEKFQLATGRNLIETLCSIYEKRIESLKENYEAVCKLDPSLLAEFEISRAGLISSLQMKLKTTKKQYWQRLFDGLSSLYDRLTSDSRQSIVRKLQAQTGIDFNQENCYAIVQWVIKNANEYFDAQLVDTFEKLVDNTNIESYASNKKVFQENKFLYKKFRHYSGNIKDVPAFKIKIGQRIVTTYGGLYRHSFSYQSGICESGANLIGDLMTIANNLGFVKITERPLPYSWDDNGAREFFCEYGGKTCCLVRVRAFLNGNMHFQFLPDFIFAINIQYGALKGWLHEGNVKEEMSVPEEVAEQFVLPPEENFKKFLKGGFQIASVSQILLK